MVEKRKKCEILNEKKLGVLIAAQRVIDEPVMQSINPVCKG